MSQVQITFPDGSVKPFAAGVTGRASSRALGQRPPQGQSQGPPGRPDGAQPHQPHKQWRQPPTSVEESSNWATYVGIRRFSSWNPAASSRPAGSFRTEKPARVGAQGHEARSPGGNGSVATNRALRVHRP